MAIKLCPCHACRRKLPPCVFGFDAIHEKEYTWCSPACAASEGQFPARILVSEQPDKPRRADKAAAKQ